jgi:hypothetical protein
VTVTATNTQTGITSTGVTNETGSYNFPSLQPGTYKVSAELPGFQTQIYNDVTLGVSQQVRLNFALPVGGQSQSVEVNVAADTLIATTSSSVGSVLPEYKVRDLPLATRNVLDLVGTTAGTQGSNFAGGRLTQLNTTRDGIPISDGRYEIGASTSTYVSPDLVDEVPRHCRAGRRGSRTRIGTDSDVTRSARMNSGKPFLGESELEAECQLVEQQLPGSRQDYYNGNQYGGRVGGPIIRNKTFFFFLFDGQRFVTKSSFGGLVLTDQARQGLFRYFPGVQNGNALTSTPTVDRAGNPVMPTAATGDLTAFNVFGREVNGAFSPWDVNRPGFDTSGWIKTLLGRMPSPNDFTVGDGLNTAGIRWLRRIEGQDNTNGNSDNTNRDQYNLRVDHNINAGHKAFFSGTWERDSAQPTSRASATGPEATMASCGARRE